MKNSQDISIDSDDGPPIRGPCGASYRPSENFAISSGHQPFLVEIKVAAKGLANVDSHAYCLGTIVTHRHILSVGNNFMHVSLSAFDNWFAATCFCNRDLPQYNLDWSAVAGCESDGVTTKRLSKGIEFKSLPNSIIYQLIFLASALYDYDRKLDNVESKL